MTTVSDRWFEMIQKVESVMAIPAEAHRVDITVSDGEKIRYSIHITGMKDEEEEVSE